MKTLQAILGGLAASGMVLAVAWCYGVDLSVRGVDLGATVITALAVGAAAGFVIFEGGAE